MVDYQVQITESALETQFVNDARLDIMVLVNRVL